MPSSKQPWLHSAVVDLIFILSPPFICLAAIIAFADFFQKSSDVPVEAWFILVLLIDVSHVYSTLFRTYLDRDTFQKQKQLMLLVPILSWVTGMLLYSVAPLIFWRVLAYLAVFHFIRQQYGFLQLYSRQEQVTKISRRINKIAIYTATIYPLLYWHLEGNRRFHWFIADDFIIGAYPKILPVLTTIYVGIILIYLINEIWHIYQQKAFNLPRNLIVAGTFLSWYLGIVYYNGDLIYTTFNVVSHGIPYLALVWIYGRKKTHKATQSKKFVPIFNRLVYRNTGVILFIGFIVVLAYVEEGIWDGLVWREHSQVFSFFSGLPQIQDGLLLTIIVPLLALPQITHYILDGFIWKVSGDKNLQALN